MKIKRALISVSDKSGIVEFAQKLHQLGVEIVSTGGTFKTLAAAQIPAIYVTEVTGFPEILDGRVKTLNPYIHGGILAVRDNPEHLAALEEHGIRGIDLVVVNLYPFRQTIAKPGVSLEEAVENIDIGGPAMIRAAAKNFRDVTVVVNPERYASLLEQLAENGESDAAFRMMLAREAYSHTAEYDACISNYLRSAAGETEMPDTLHLVYEKTQSLRYGENPHQAAAFYLDRLNPVWGVGAAKQLHGKELSFNNIVDLEAAYQIVRDFANPAVAIIKHTNPCGTAQAETIAEAYQMALDADPVSAFGGIIGLNNEVDAATAEKMSSLFIEAIIAPGYTPEALEILTKKANLRLLQADFSDKGRSDREIKCVSGGALMQERDLFTAPQQEMRVVTKAEPTKEEWQELLLAWNVVKHVKSNAIVVSKNGATLGVGAGQMNRVGAAGIALTQAGEQAVGAVLASDAFFPFRDTIDAAAAAGIKAIIQPGGSMRDAESIAAADEHGIAMVFTGVRHFKH